MTKPAVTPRARLRAVAAAILGVFGALACAAPAHASDPLTTVLDRTNSEPVDVPATTERAQDRLRQRLGDAALLETDPVTGTPRIVARLDGYLTPPSSKDPETIALDYVRDHAGAFGVDAGDLADLRLTDSEQGPDGTVHLSWEQRAGGLPNVDGGLQAAVTAEGRLLNVRGGVVPDLDADSPEPLVSADAAYATALPGAGAAPPSTAPAGADRATSFQSGGSASLVRYQDEGRERIGWRVLAPAGSSAFYDAIVDARTGTLLRRFNRVRFASRINHFDVNPRAEGGQATNSVIPAHWLDGSPVDPEPDYLRGPYVHAVSDLDDTTFLPEDSVPPFALNEEPVPAEDDVESTAPPEEEPQWEFDPLLGSAHGFCDELCSWKTSDVTANRDFSTAQLFWYVNTFRDHLAEPPIGFTAASGGFEGDDPVLAQALDGAATDDPDSNLPHPDNLSNASMLTLPDGYRGLMEVNLFALFRRYDGAHDAALVYHEYTHGLTDRLVTDVDGYGAMFGHQPGAMAEGISDFYALDFLAESQPDLVPDTTAPGEVRFGLWLQKDPERLMRTESVDCAVGDAASACPGTSTAGAGGYHYGHFANIGPDGAEVHDDGEIWGQTLWSLRSELIADHGAEAGVSLVRRYVTDALRLAPIDPTFLDMRNAIVLAAVAAGASDEDVTTLWDVFASRGMGWSASTTGRNDIAPSAAFDLPPAATTGAPSAVQESAATLSGMIDPNGAATSYVFEFGETSNYGSATTLASVGSGVDPVAVEEPISGLRAGATYHYRVVAVRGAKTMPGLDRTFTTPAPPDPPPSDPPPSDPPPPNPPGNTNPTPTARPTLLTDTKLKANRKGLFKVRAFFGDAAPAGIARFSVIGAKRRLYARAAAPVRIGGNVIKTLKLTKKGLKAIKPGKSKRITLELRLPSGEKYKKTLRLTRSKR